MFFLINVFRYYKNKNRIWYLCAKTFKCQMWESVESPCKSSLTFRRQIRASLAFKCQILTDFDV